MISIHALREEGDGALYQSFLFMLVFLSTPSVRRATVPYSTYLEIQKEFLSTPSARRATREAFYVRIS